MNNVLAIDTSSPILSVALMTGNGKISETKLVGFLQHAEKLLPMVAHLLKEKKAELQDIDTFLIDRGPGSFTGLRIGFSTLKGFLVTAKKPCFGALSLDMIAENAHLPEKSSLAVCIDARRERVYMRLYRRKQGRWDTTGKVQVLPWAEIQREFPKKTYLTGDAIHRYGDGIKKTAGKKKIEFLPQSTWFPRAATMISWFQEKIPKKTGIPVLQRLEKPRDFLPVYFRKSEAEEKRSAYVV